MPDSRPEYRILRLISQEPITTSEIAQASGMRPNVIARYTQRLLLSGLIGRGETKTAQGRSVHTYRLTLGGAFLKEELEQADRVEDELSAKLAAQVELLRTKPQQNT